MNAIDYLNKQDFTISNAGFGFETFEGMNDSEASLVLNDPQHLRLTGLVDVRLSGNKATVNWLSGSTHSDAHDAYQMAKALQLAASIAMGWEALQMRETDEVTS